MPGPNRALPKFEFLRSTAVPVLGPKYYILISPKKLFNVLLYQVQ